MEQITLAKIEDTDAFENIQEIAKCFAEKLKPLKIFLFGSYATGKASKDSDYDFYIVVDDERNVSEVSTQAYRAIRHIRKRPVDIVVGTKGRFEKYGNSKDSLFVEGEVARTGKLIYDDGDHDQKG